MTLSRCRISIVILLILGCLRLENPSRSGTKVPGAAGFLSEPAAAATVAEEFNAKIERTNYRGWDAFELSNGLISLFIVPDIGGRAIQLQLGGQDFFFVNPDLAGKVLPESQNNKKAGFANYGGEKVWPAPEGWTSDEEWPSIPYFVLDGSRHQAEIILQTPEEVALRVTSPPDPRTGVQFVRTFHVYSGTTRIRVDQVMKNISHRQIRWGIWSLVQHDATDAHDPSKPNPDLYVYVPVNPRSIYPDGYSTPFGHHPSYTLIDGGRMLRVHYLYHVGKVIADSNGGWYALVNGQKDICFVDSFKYFAGAEYPDNASVESWDNGPGTVFRNPFFQTLSDDPKQTPYFLETETLSPFATLDPGENYQFTVWWSPTRVTNPIQSVGWAGAISEPLTAHMEGKEVRLQGVFGVYTPGTAEAVFYGPQGEILKEEALQPIDPREVFRLDRSVPLPGDTYRISLMVRNLNGDNLGYLGNAILH